MMENCYPLQQIILRQTCYGRRCFWTMDMSVFVTPCCLVVCILPARAVKGQVFNAPGQTLPSIAKYYKVLPSIASAGLRCPGANIAKYCQVLQSIAQHCKKSAGLRCPGADIAKRTSYLAIWARPHTRRLLCTSLLSPIIIITMIMILIITIVIIIIIIASYLAIQARPHTRRSSQPPSHTPSPPPNIIIIQILLCGSFPQRCENLIARKLQKLEVPRALELGIVIATDQ